jgi:hypothetical protein
MDNLIANLQYSINELTETREQDPRFRSPSPHARALAVAITEAETALLWLRRAQELVGTNVPLTHS